MKEEGYVYSILRFCRNLSREEFINVGILFSTRDYLELRVNPDNKQLDSLCRRYLKAMEDILPELRYDDELSLSGITDNKSSMNEDIFDEVKRRIKGEDASLSWSDNRCGILLGDKDEDRIDQLYKELVLP